MLVSRFNSKRKQCTHAQGMGPSWDHCAWRKEAQEDLLSVCGVVMGACEAEAAGLLWSYLMEGQELTGMN